MPHISGQQLLDRIREEYPHIPVIVITAANEVQTAVECMRAGAFDYMVKAIEESRLLSGVCRAIEFRELKREYGELRSRFLADELDHPEAFSHIITRSSKMKSIFIYVEAVANTGEPVLITGETGAGKDLIAHAIHKVSGRSGDFVAVNIALPGENTFADDLFGHTAGAFTGAVKSRGGFTQRAAGGTLFLDEIGDLSVEAQIKLLKFLDSFEYYPVGSDLPKRSDARIVLATNRDLDAQMNEKKLRRDLYHRISTHEIHVPPLRERREDLPLLLEHFIKRETEKFKKSELTVPAELIAQLSHYPFPGNIRELEKYVIDAVAVAKPGDSNLPMQRFLEAICKNSSDITTEPPDADPDSTPLLRFGPILPTIKQARELLTAEALRRTGGIISKAAKLLGITHQALSKWMKRNDKNCE
jgi:DNA-binding NtrC family response regulator